VSACQTLPRSDSELILPEYIPKNSQEAFADKLDEIFLSLMGRLQVRVATKINPVTGG
jgi:hypothetical protein